MAYTTIDDPSAHFQTALYTGNGSTQSITNDGNSDLQPDLIWAKNRNDSYDNVLGDSTRGAGLTLISNSSGAEVNEGTNGLTSFDSDGFSLGGNSGGWNFSSAKTYVAWQWKANAGSTSSNTDGTLTSTVQANTDAGFSIVTFTTDGTTKTVGHGLGVKPDIVLVKSRNAAGSWIFITDIVDGSMDYGVLNSTAAFSAIGYNPPTSSVFEYNDNNTYTQVAYCFAEKQGYSKFGKYTANGNANGNFVYTGFKPAVIIMKSTSLGGWLIIDSTRTPINDNSTDRLFPNTTDAEDNFEAYDFLSNGFKLRTASGIANQSGETYVYMAFAENPFVTSTGIPTTAR